MSERGPRLRELELKLLAAGPLDPRDLATNGLALGVEERGSRTLTATYHDTEDLRLARWGATLRYRTGEGRSGRWTLKLPDAGLGSRTELDFRGSPQKVPDEVHRLVVALVRSAPLKPAAKLRTRRRTWALTDSEGEVAELVDDDVSVLEGRVVAARFREVEIEARSATLAQLEEIARALKKGGAVPGDQIPKAVRAFGPRAQAPPDVPVSDPVRPGDPAAGAVRAVLLDGTRRVMRHHAGVVLGDAESVHQMRVGARRLRSDLRTFSSLVDEAWARAVTVNLAWLAGVLGEVRDLDVLGERLRGHATRAADLAPMFDRLDDRREACRDELLRALVSDRYVALLDGLVVSADDPPVTPPAGAPCRKVLAPLVAAAWSPLGKAGRLLDESDAEEDWHRVRKKAKRARYAAEAAARCLGPAAKEARRFAAECESVQEVLGEHQDAVVARDTVTAMAKEIEAPPAFHFAAGRLAETEDRAARAARSAFPGVWERLDRKKRRKWFS